MAKDVWDNDPLVIIRHALQRLWDDGVDYKSRGWGKKRDDNPFPETNIILGKGDEAVLICKKDGKPVRHQLRIVEETKLGREIEEVLQRLENQFRKLSQEYPNKWVALDVYTQELIAVADNTADEKNPTRNIKDALREKGIEQFEFVIIEHLTPDRQPIL